RCHVYGRPPHPYDAEIGSATCEVRCISTRDHGLGRRAAVVHAGAAELTPLDDRHLHALRREARGQRWARLAHADYYCVKAGVHRPLWLGVGMKTPPVPPGGWWGALFNSKVFPPTAGGTSHVEKESPDVLPTSGFRFGFW